MGSSETFCLRWNEFEGNVSRSFSSIRSDNQFFDCTLTTDDDNDEEYSDNLRAHKVILSACSQFFKNILTKESMSVHPNPLIYLKGISAKELKSVLDFMYHGEVNVAKDELDKFLEAANILKIKGLTARNKKSPAIDGPGSSPTNPSLSPGPCDKRPPAKIQSTPITMSDSEVIVKKECDPLVPIVTGDLEYSCNDIGGGDNNDICDDDFERGYEANEENVDHRVSEALGNQVFTQVSDGTRTCKRIASATSPSSLLDVPSKKMKLHDSASKSPKTTDTAKSESEALVENGSEDFEDKVVDSDKEHKDKIEDEYDDGAWADASKLSTKGDGENSARGNGEVGKGKSKRFHPKGRGGTHMNESERVTLVNLIKTLDKDRLLRGEGGKEREAVEKRKVLWLQLVSTFNEICGLNYDKGKLKNALNRIKNTPSWKSHSLLFEDC